MKKLIPLTTLIMTAVAPAAMANEADSLRVYNVDDVVVTATRTPLPLKNTPVLTRVITAAEIERQALPTLEDVLQRELAGVEFHQAGYGTTMSFQGLDARYVLILVDGERLAGETYGNIDYSRIPVSAIDRIEIIRGAASVLYGSNAMGAVINVITKMPKERFEIAGSVRYGTSFQTNAGENLGSGAAADDLTKYRNRLDLPNTKTDLSVGFNLGKFRSLTSASFRTVDAYKLRGTKDEMRHYSELVPMSPKISGGPGGMTMEMDANGMPVFVAGTPVYDTVVNVPPDARGLGVSGWRDWYVGQKFDYTVSEKFRFELSGNYTNRNRYDFHTSVMDDNPMSGIFGSSPLWTYEIYESYNARFLMEHSPNMDHKVYLSFLRDESFRDSDNLHARTHKQRHTYNIPRLLWTWNAGEWNRLTTGLEMINEQLRFDLNPEGFDDAKTLTSASLYVQDEILSGRTLSFVAGLRGDWSEKFGFRVTPKVSAKYSFSNFGLRLNYANGYRSPSIKEMYMLLDLPIASAPQIHGNPDLKAETNHYLSLSLDYDRDWMYASASISKSFFRDKIEAVWSHDEDDRRVMKYENIDKSEYTTLEVLGRFRLAAGLYFTGNYNYIIEDSFEAAEGMTQYIFPSPHTATFSLDYSFLFKGQRITANASVRYIGPKDYEDFMTYIYLPQPLVDFIMADPKPPMSPELIGAMQQYKYFTGSYKSRHKGYAVCNISLDVETTSHVSLTIGVDNLFNYQPKVVNFNSALTPGRSGFIKMGFRF